uniref:Uncharacterized protein n=1 Tax=Loa loa TaxID=7209 RepID=A0A1I7VGA2_LOALO
MSSEKEAKKISYRRKHTYSEESLQTDVRNSKPPKSRYSSETEETQVSSASLLQRLMEFGGEQFHRTTRITGSIRKKRFTNRLALTLAKRMESLIGKTNDKSKCSSILTVSPEIGSVELGKDKMEYIDAKG